MQEGEAGGWKRRSKATLRQLLWVSFPSSSKIWQIMKDLRALLFKPKNGLVEMRIERVITHNEKSVPFVEMVFCSSCL